MYTDIKSYEDACVDQKKDPTARPDYSKCELSPAEEDSNLAIFELSRILVSVNKEKGKMWKPKPTDRRFYPWCWIEKDESDPSGVGLSLVVVDNDYSLARVAARLSCRDAARARYIFDQFKPLLKRILIFHH